MPGFFINMIELDNKTVARTREKNTKTARKQFSEWVSLITTRTSSTSALTSLAYPDEETKKRNLKMRAKRSESRKHFFSRHREGKINFLKL